MGTKLLKFSELSMTHGKYILSSSCSTLTFLLNLQFGISLRARKQHVAHSYVANCDDSVCNTDETAACHSNVRFASDASQHRLCSASAVVNQANDSQRVVCWSLKNI